MKSRSHVMETCKTCRSGLAFYPEHPTPKSCRTQGRRPHVPSSTITMSKSHRQDKSDNLRSPLLLSGDSCPYLLATEGAWRRSEEHTSELQSLMRITYPVFCLKKK